MKSAITTNLTLKKIVNLIQPGVVGIEPTHGASKVHCLTDLAIPQPEIKKI